MAQWIIRVARTDDADALARCVDAAYADARKRITDLPPVSEGLADDIKRNLVWVAEQENSIIGGLVLIPKDGFALLANVAVDPAYAGMGVGGGLIRQAENECRNRGLNELLLSTHVDMPENVALYQHLGWAETGRSGNKVQMIKQI